MKRKAPRRPHVPIIETKPLGRYWEWADNERRVVELDPSLHGRGKLEAMIHGWLHLESWALSEEMVRKVSRGLTAFLHKHHVRVIEPGNQPLDLSKLKKKS